MREGIPHAALVDRPPSMHWLGVFILSCFTLGIYWYVCLYQQARWTKRVLGRSFAYAWTIVCLVWVALVVLVDVVLMIMHYVEHLPMLRGDDGGSSMLAGIYLVTIFIVRQEIEDATGLKLSGVMTFLFGPMYFQFHLADLSIGVGERDVE